MPPDMPKIAAAQGGDKQVNLRWDAVPSSVLYTVYWNTSGDVSARDEKVTTKDLSWTHAALRNGSKYYYRVSASNVGGESALARAVAGTQQVCGVGTTGRTFRRIGWRLDPAACAHHGGSHIMAQKLAGEELRDDVARFLNRRGGVDGRPQMASVVQSF